MRILDRYLLKELLMTFLAVLAVLLLITFGAETTKLLALAVEGKIPASVVFQVLFLKIPPALEVILPLVALLSVMLAVGRLYQDHEMVVLNSCSVPPRYFQKVVFWFLLPIALLTAWITLYASPWSYEKEKDLIIEAQTSSPFAGLVAGKFNSLPEENGVLYARKIDADGRMKGIWIQYQSEQNDLILTAPSGQFEWINQRLALVLEQGKSYEGLTESKQTLTVQYFDRFEGYLPELAAAAGSQRDKRTFASTSELMASEDMKDKVLLQWRFIVPFGVITLGLLGLRLSKTEPREGRFGKLFIAIILYLVYFQLLFTLKKFSYSQISPMEYSLWLIPLVFLVFALWQPRRKRPKKLTDNLAVKGGAT